MFFKPTSQTFRPGGLRTWIRISGACWRSPISGFSLWARIRLTRLRLGPIPPPMISMIWWQMRRIWLNSCPLAPEKTHILRSSETEPSLALPLFIRKKTIWKSVWVWSQTRRAKVWESISTRPLKTMPARTLTVKFCNYPSPALTSAPWRFTKKWAMR